MEIYSTIQEWLPSKNQGQVSFGNGMHLALGVPRSQNLLESNLDYLVASDEAPVTKVVSCLSTFQV